MAVKPLGERIVLKRLDAEDQTTGGIIVPDSAKEKPQQGEVVAVGPGQVLESGQTKPLDVKKGDRVLYGKYSGTEVTVDGDELLILREEDVLAIIES